VLGDEFWSRVDKSGACWVWRGARTRDGYGVARIGGKRVLAHRASWADANGRDVPPGMFVCHHCDNPPCVRPAHLFAGTGFDNMRDAAAKGRLAMQVRPWRSSFLANKNIRARGEESGTAKLNEAAVRKIRALDQGGATTQQIVAEVAVSPSQVRRILTGKAWAHVPLEPGQSFTHRGEGSNHRSAKLDESKVLAIRTMAGEGKDKAEIARQFGVARSTVERVLAGQRWRSGARGGS